jgi:hypothetical protein
MAFDDPDAPPPLPIQSIEQARIAAQCILDWADYNVTCWDACDQVSPEVDKIYQAAKDLVESLK